MRAIPLERTGPPSVLRVKELPEPTPGAGEVVVRVRAVGLNFAEVLSRKGLYGWAPPRPYVPGMEAAGEIESAGAGVARRAGEPVIVGAQYGCYAERVRVAAHQALPAVPSFSMEENAAFAVNYLTAWTALFEMARLRPSDTVLVTAAAGGVGSAAVQLASRFGCTVVGAAGGAEKLETVRRMGAAHAVDYRAAGLEEALRAVPRPPDVVLELVGGATYRAALRAAAPLGRIVVAGFAEMSELRRTRPLSWWRTWRAVPRAPLETLMRRSLAVASTHLGYLLREPALVARIWGDLVAFTEKHAIRPLVGARLAGLERIAEGHALLESRRSTGKVVVTL